YFQHLDAAACAFGHLHFPYRRHLGRMLIADVASAGIPRDGDLRAVYGLFTFTPKGWRVQIRRVRYPVRRATQAITARRVPGGPLLVHKLLEARYRHHQILLEAARRHSGLPRPPSLRSVTAAQPLVRAPVLNVVSKPEPVSVVDALDSDDEPATIDQLAASGSDGEK